MYGLFHLKIRNDQEPSRVPYVSIFESFEDAYKAVPVRQNNFNILKQGSSIWIDEWIRKRNGDDYKIVKLFCGMEYYDFNLTNKSLIYKSEEYEKDLSYQENVVENIVEHILIIIKIEDEDIDDIGHEIKYWLYFENNLDKILEITTETVENLKKGVWKHEKLFYKLLNTKDVKNHEINLNSYCNV